MTERDALAGYTKLFGSILDSSVWREPPLTRLVWVTLLAMADRDGIVEASVDGIADRAKLKISAVETALECFLSPDVKSKNPANEGRRIERTNDGFRLLNYEFYRQKQSAEEMRARSAERQRRFRERQAAKKTDVTPPVTQSNKSNDIASASPPQKAEADPEAPVTWADLLPTEADRVAFYAPTSAHGLLSLFGKLWSDKHKREWQGRRMGAKTAEQFMERSPDERKKLAPLLKPAIERFLADVRHWYASRGWPFDAFVKDFDVHVGGLTGAVEYQKL